MNSGTKSLQRRGLTWRQARYVFYRLVGKNRRRAALLSGYKDLTARRITETRPRPCPSITCLAIKRGIFKEA